ncbi:PLDc N-terminal domain-containing protein [Paraflavisolibacter sp. H34]|uniref:PLDc N-terminal domain-containing protein n=1 Tax=Huijunlia imazamoxiresistens TaxID=3127457 RepID=UPI00301A4BEE
MKYTRHPNFFLGIFSIIVVLVGIGLNSNGYEIGNTILIASVILAGIHWIWSIIDVIGRHDMRPFQKRFWLIAVVAVPALGSLLFYLMHQERNKIIT